MTLHPKRCALCTLCKMELGYTNPFCTFNRGMTSMPRQLIAFIAVRGCASFDAGISETVARLEIREEIESKSPFRFRPEDLELGEWCKLHEEVLKDIRTEAYRSGFHDGEKCEMDKYEKILLKMGELFIDSDEDTFQCRDCNSIMRKHMIEIRQELG